jgi:lipopolysaccharide transport system permease protein
MNRILKELWKFRVLITSLTSRHLATRYRGSFLGFLWSFLNPLLLISIYALVFKYYIRFQEVEHYTAFMMAGLLPWIWFSSGILEATASISSGGSLITKAIFSPQVLPVVAVLTNLCHFVLALPLLFGLLYIYSISVGLSILFLPVLIFLQLFFMTGLSLILSALNVYYRDIQHILGNILSFIFFLCPIIYPAANVPAQFRFTLTLNPISLLIINYQRVILDRVNPPLTELAILLGISLVIFAIGCWVFNRNRDHFAESI